MESLILQFLYYVRIFGLRRVAVKLGDHLAVKILKRKSFVIQGGIGEARSIPQLVINNLTGLVDNLTVSLWEVVVQIMVVLGAVKF